MVLLRAKVEATRRGCPIACGCAAVFHGAAGASRIGANGGEGTDVPVSGVAGRSWRASGAERRNCRVPVGHGGRR